MSELRELNNVSLPFALDKKGNYIYIKDADRETKYYCPCCNKEVNTIAIDDDIDYIMPPHYRHYPNQSCSGESLAHWVYKMWLFDKGSQFYVSNGLKKDLHIVKSINIENTYTTDYGGYRPDLTITTTYDKIFYFELNFSNPKRSDDYFCKWSQLNNDVIEVDVKKLLKESLNNKIPTFRLIYSEGICFDDKYNKRDTFAGIANKLHIRKEEIKRQDMLNYKATWEKLDWFFDSIKMYKAMKSTMHDVINSFSDVPFEEMELCFNIVKNISCIDNNDGFRKIINAEFSKNINQFIENKLSNDNYITSIQCNIEIKKGCDIKICAIHKKCNIMNFSSPIYKGYAENRKWYMGYDYYKTITNTINSLISNFYNYYCLIDKINNHFTWNKYPLFFDKLNFDERIIIDNYYTSRDITISSNYNSNVIIDSINIKYNRELIDLYRYELQKTETDKMYLIYEKINSKYNNIFDLDMNNRNRKYTMEINEYKTSFYCRLAINLNNNEIKLYINNNFISKYELEDLETLYEMFINLIDNTIITELEIHQIKKEKKTIEENLYEEHINSSYYNKEINSINDWLSSYNLSLHIYYNSGCVNFKYCSNLIIWSNYNCINSLEILLETFVMIVENEKLYDYILNNISTWMSDNFINLNNFINSISDYNNDMWEFALSGNNIEIQLKYTNPVGYIKYKTSRVKIKLDVIDNSSIGAIKSLLVDKMDYMLDSTIEYYNNKYQNCRLMRMRRTLNV